MGSWQRSGAGQGEALTAVGVAVLCPGRCCSKWGRFGSCAACREGSETPAACVAGGGRVLHVPFPTGKKVKKDLEVNSARSLRS